MKTLNRSTTHAFIVLAISQRYQIRIVRQFFIDYIFKPGLLFSLSTWTRPTFDHSEVKIDLYRLVLYTYDYYRRFNYILARWLTSSRPTKTFLSHINQIRIHCLYQKIHVFYFIPNFSLQLYSFYGCIAHFVSDLVLNPEYRFSRVVAHIKPY